MDITYNDRAASSDSIVHMSRQHDEDVNVRITMSDSEFRSRQRLLYTSHFLSTWNSRAFEFGAFLFLAAIYPQSLLPASLYALLRAFSAVVFAPMLGRIVDTTDRLVAVRASIGKRIERKRS